MGFRHGLHDMGTRTIRLSVPAGPVVTGFVDPKIAISGVFRAAATCISPESFVFLESAIILAIVVLGGMGSQIGVVLAAIAVTILPELAREFSEYRMLIFGAAMVLMMVWRPQGLMPMRRIHIELKRQE